MRYASTLAGAIAAIALTSLVAPVQAAPPSGIGGDLKTAAGDSTPIEQIRHRCYWHRGHYHCPRHGYRRYYGPGVQFYFGPRHRHHHHRHYRHHRRY